MHCHASICPVSSRLCTATLHFAQRYITCHSTSLPRSTTTAAHSCISFIELSLSTNVDQTSFGTKESEQTAGICSCPIALTLLPPTHTCQAQQLIMHTHRSAGNGGQTTPKQRCELRPRTGPYTTRFVACELWATCRCSARLPNVTGATVRRPRGRAARRVSHLKRPAVRVPPPPGPRLRRRRQHVQQ